MVIRPRVVPVMPIRVAPRPIQIVGSNAPVQNTTPSTCPSTPVSCPTGQTVDPTSYCDMGCMPLPPAPSPNQSGEHRRRGIGPAPLIPPDPGYVAGLTAWANPLAALESILPAYQGGWSHATLGLITPPLAILALIFFGASHR